MDTGRIASGYDIELNLGAGWFLTALRGLHDIGALLPDPLPPPVPPGAEVEVGAVDIVGEPDADLVVELVVAGIPVQVRVVLALDAEGTTLTFTTDLPGVTFSVPFDAVDGLAGPPALRVLAGDADHEPAVGVLADLDLRANPQDEEPLDADAYVPRGDPSLARSVLPVGGHLAVGLGRATFERYANDVWHTSLRAPDGSHPLPHPGRRLGAWSGVSMTPSEERIRLRLEGDVHADTPLIDIIPDPHVTVTVDVHPRLVDGVVVTELRPDVEVDAGLLGDLVAFLAGGLLPNLMLPSIGDIGLVVVLEGFEEKVGTLFEAALTAAAEPLPVVCAEGVVHVVIPPAGSGVIPTDALDLAPRPIAIHVDRPDPLAVRTLVVDGVYDELTIDEGGMLLAGLSIIGERFRPVLAHLVGATYADDELESLDYEVPEEALVTLPVQDAVERMSGAELVPPLVFAVHEDEVEDTDDGAPDLDADPPQLRLPTGRLVTTCSDVVAVRREKTIVTHLRLSSGVDLRVEDAVRLQEAGVIVLHELQLIRPSDARPYFRTPPDATTTNNLESLPTF